MKINNYLALSIFACALNVHGAYATDCPCPQPPPGYECYEEAPATYTHPVAFTSYYPPAAVGGTIKTYLRFQFWANAGTNYEVQYARTLNGPWYAYTRGTVSRSDWLLTDHPIYQCEVSRFFRVMSE